MKLYMQTNTDGVITDVITYPYGDYAEIEHPLPLPDGLLGGWYRWAGGDFVFDQALYDVLHPEEEPPVEPINEYQAYYEGMTEVLDGE